MWRLTFVARFILPLICVSLVSCAKELHEPLPPEIVSINISEGQRIVGNETIIVEFSKEMESVSIEVSGALGATSLTGKTAEWTPSMDISLGTHTLIITGTDETGYDLEETISIGFIVMGKLVDTKIAFSLDGDIHVINADGSDQTKLTSGIGTCREPSWSPDGKRICFASWYDGDSQIYVMNADGTDLVKLTSGQSPSWSPDGTKIAFASLWEICVMDADGTNLVELTSGQNPSWSPDGTKIAFASDPDGWQWGIYVMNVDGTDQMRLADIMKDQKVAWSPDGTIITYHIGVSMFVMNTDGTDHRELTSVAAVSPSWSPDGTMIACHRGGYIYVMKADGTDQSMLTSGQYPTWSPFLSQ